MEAIALGFAAAGFWAITTLVSARASRAIGAGPTLGLVMLLGLAIAVPLVLLGGMPSGLGPAAGAWLLVAGLGNVTGLFLQYRGVQTGQVGVVGAISSTMGAITAVIAIVLGEPVVAGVVGALAMIVVGVVLTAAGERAVIPGVAHPSDARRAALFGIGSAIGFGVGLYAAGRLGNDLTIAWAILPARLVGAVVIALPLAVRGRLRADRSTLPLVVIIALAEVGGIVAYALGARSSIAVTAVIGSQFGVIAAVVAYFLYGERLARRQWIGVATVALGVAVLGVLRA